ncbi:alkaline phosphatase family protein [Sphingomonas abietis]|uniref:Alkaline phosphatase n=1 Tax=Sphingomonas abietis TaxID=3012344 RepID=A0ABY7NPX6_9SPHN|nr:alkaline phosphatase family protein [Sphingomonas abietis]WBO23573.1 alkaline phosphatase family protein [Sphingomonas abietis]
MRSSTIAAGFAALLGLAPALAAPPPEKPKLIVAISVDQFSSELYRRYLSSYTGGLKTLSSGVAFPVGYQSHAATETCPGHSTILSGMHPEHTGIIANSWFDAKTGSNIYCVQAPGSSDPNARGPQNMHVTTLGDWVKAAEPGARSFAVSGKDRAAITMAGKHADGVYWWVDGEGFTTSHFAGPVTPAVTQPAATFDRSLFARWKASPPPLYPAVSATCAAMEKPVHFGKIDISGHVPPDLAARAEQNPQFLMTTDFQDNLRASPLFDATIVDFAEQVIAQQHLGHGPATDVLAVSLSANDYIGHRYGNGGPEMCVQQAGLDATLGRFVGDLERLGVPVMVVLTADHGATDAAEREHEHDPKASRLDSAAFVSRLNKAVMQQTGLSYEPIVGDDPQQLTINVGPDAALRAQVQDATIAWLKQQPEVHAVYTRAEVEAATVPPHTPPTELSFVQRFHESYDRDRSGDIAVAYGERTSFGLPRGPGDVVAGHGSPWDHDRQVPILFWWPGVDAQTRATPIETVDIAPTLAALAGVKTPAVDGQCVDLGGDMCGK